MIGTPNQETEPGFQWAGVGKKGQIWLATSLPPASGPGVWCGVWLCAPERGSERPRSGAHGYPTDTRTQGGRAIASKWAICGSWREEFANMAKAGFMFISCYW